VVLDVYFFFFSSRRRHTRCGRDWSSDVCSSDLLERTKTQLPNVKLVICEPFAVKGVKAVDDTWYPEFDGYRAAAKEIASASGAVFVPFQKVFDQAEKVAPGSYWTTDGVHPSLAGSQLMAQAWLKAVK